MHKLVKKLSADYPTVIFSAGDQLCWSPGDNTVYYPKTSTSSEQLDWSILHETGHALLNHQNYTSDIQLIEMEAQAWQKATEIAHDYNISIDNDYIEDCMDTYRDWLHSRSACPTCETRSLPKDSHHYQCFNCGQIWIVSSSRFCRPYRRKLISK